MGLWSFIGFSAMLSQTEVAVTDVPSESDIHPPKESLGAYIFQQHGDRTGKAEQYMTGLYFRDRYLSSDSQYRIESIKTDVSLKQIVIRSPKYDWKCVSPWPIPADKSLERLGRRIYGRPRKSEIPGKSRIPTQSNKFRAGG
ncbi:hypothetical protein N7486_006552 [Penicillium sp. IBT 16267x]|nr:hypothetical protein N7486_006552 [Penicillium sp. IBT 16267x]